MNENDFLKYAKEGKTIEALSEYHEICTDLLLKATKMFDILLVDHIVIGLNNYTSIVERIMNSEKKKT